MNKWMKMKMKMKKSENALSCLSLCGIPLLYERIDLFSDCVPTKGLWVDKKSLLLSKSPLEVYESINLIFESIRSIDGVGYITLVDLNTTPIFCELKRVFIKEKLESALHEREYPQIYHWIFNALLTLLYDLTLHILYKTEDLKSEDLKAKYLLLSDELFSFITPSLRKKLQNPRISVCKEIISGFDTEYKNTGMSINALLSAQLAVNGLISVKIPYQSFYKLSDINTESMKEYLLNISPCFEREICEASLNNSIKSIRTIKYSDYDLKVNHLIKNLETLKEIKTKKIRMFMKDSCYYLSFPKTSLISFIYYNENQSGINFIDLVRVSNLLIESKISAHCEKVLGFLGSLLIGENPDVLLSSFESLVKKEEEEEEETLIEVSNLDFLNPLESKIKSQIKKSKNGKIYGISYCVRKTNSFISHLTTADLCMFNDFETLKEKFRIVGKSFVTMRGFLIDNTLIHVRDSMLLSPQGKRSLFAIGEIHKIEKEKLSNEELLNMDSLLKYNKKKFREYAIRDAEICLVHGNYMRDFNFTLKGIGIPLTLSSLGGNYVRSSWSSKGYSGYQLNSKYMLWQMEKVMTPKGIHQISPHLSRNLATDLPSFIGNYKGGRNESFMYGKDSQLMFYDYDLTSAYTTVMAYCGNPVYSKGQVLSEEELLCLPPREIIYSYLIISVEFRFPEGTKYPSIPVYIDETSTVYPLNGKAFLTGAEYLLARSQGCVLKIFKITYYPFEKEEVALESENSEKNGVKNPITRDHPFYIKSTVSKGKEYVEHYTNHPFYSILGDVQSKRREHEKGTIQNLLYKEMGNSIYGQVVRGMSHKKKFDTETRLTKRMTGTDLTNPLIASWVTGMIRSIVGECLHYISEELGGKVISVTTDGFITDASDLEKGILLTDVENLEEKTKCCILLKEYRKMREYLSGDPVALEMKKSGKGIISWTTRGQFSKSSGIKATTGLQTFISKDELESVLSLGMDVEGRQISYIQCGLRSAKDIFLKGGHVTPSYTDVVFKMNYDNRREIIPACKSNLLDSRPWETVESCINARYLSKLLKTKPYNKYTSKVGISKYKSNEELFVRNLVKILHQKESCEKYGIFQNKWSHSEIKTLLLKLEKRYKFGAEKIIDQKSNWLKKIIAQIGLIRYKYLGCILMPHQVPLNETTEKLVKCLKIEKVFEKFSSFLFFKKTN